MRIFLLCTLLSFGYFGSTQSFLKTQGKDIVNENGDPFLLRGMGLGGWMVQEGYMLQTADFANPQHEIKEFIEELVGAEATEEFYDAWLANHVSKSDIDLLAEWGFNSVRLPMHYNLYTLPIEDEPVEGENTWIDKGFVLTDSLISWCAQNNIYVVLDMHATPGGQGYDSGISDYDPTKPSLFESEANQEKLASLWKQLAIRYKDEPWVAGYDLINEPNWDLPGGTLLRTIYERVTDSIRTIDTEHILFIEGNWFANDFTGLTPPWDDEIVYSPHKYWSVNDQASIQWVLDLRDTYDRPLYLGESGENSNQWFRDAIALLEGENIGWAWWPMKKIEAIAGPLSVNKTFGYEAILNYGKGTGPKPTEESAKLALTQVANNFKTQNCVFEPGVIDAMFRQVSSDETVPYKTHSIPGVINAAHYDLGSEGNAYFDTESGTYHVTTGEYTAWNNGWTLRNDGVDIEPTMDQENEAQINVGWTAEGEWMKYSLSDVEEGAYTVNLRTAGGDFGGKFHFSADGVDITDSPFVPFSGGYQSWQTTTVENVVLYAETDHIVFHSDGSGFNLGQFEFIKTGEISDIATTFVSGITKSETVVSIDVNKFIEESSVLNPSDFSLLVSGQIITPVAAQISSEDARIIELTVDQELTFQNIIKASYLGNSIASTDGVVLDGFTLKDITNNLEEFFVIPTKIEAEDYFNQEGIQLESTSDLGGGQNIGYLDPGDFCDYDVFIPSSGQYAVKYRNASDGGSGGLSLSLIDEAGAVTVIETVDFTSTGGWQSWETTNSQVILPSGRYTLRLTITKPLFNLNWIEFDLISEVSQEPESAGIYPNPVGDVLFFDFRQKVGSTFAEIYDVDGRVVLVEQISQGSVDVSKLQTGFYYCRIKDGTKVYVSSFVKI